VNFKYAANLNLQTKVDLEIVAAKFFLNIYITFVLIEQLFNGSVGLVVAHVFLLYI